MGTLYLIRHGQASFGADDYDRLSALGARQCEALGAWMRHQGMQFEAVLRGSLRRHAQSLDALASALPGLPAAFEWPGLNEYDPAAVVRAIHPEPLTRARDAQEVRQHFRLLRDGLLRWTEGRTQPEGMPPWESFVAGVTAALDHVRGSCEGPVLLMSSGGPIAAAVAHVLGAPAAVAIELNLSLRNSAVTEFGFNARRHSLRSFNGLPHLAQPDRAEWITYA